MAAIAAHQSIHHHLPAHELQGVAPNGTPAFCNKRASDWDGEESMVDHFNAGIQWQCVEYARRWLWDAHGLILPSVSFAAHIFHLGHVYDPVLGRNVETVAVKNGTIAAPEANTLIIYAMSKSSFVGHVGVIVEASETFIRVADQNRYHHHWGGRHYSKEFPVVRRPDGTYHIDDDEGKPLGWIRFPQRGAILAQEEAAGIRRDALPHPVTKDAAFERRVCRPFPADMTSSPTHGYGRGFCLWMSGFGDVIKRKVYST